MIQLMAHQLRGVEIARQFPRYAYFHEPGCGKTAMICGILDDERSPGSTREPLKTLVVAPKSILRAAWANDARHFPRLRVAVCWAETPAKRRALINTPGADLLVTNFEQFKKHAADFRAAGVRRLVIDESSKCKNVESQVTKAAAEFAAGMDSVYLLSGTPAPNSETEYFAQMLVLDPGVFGRMFYPFAYRYFDPIKKPVPGRWTLKPLFAKALLDKSTYRPPTTKAMDYGMLRRLFDGADVPMSDVDLYCDPLEAIGGWTIKDDRKDEFFDRLASRSWSLRKADCVDLPGETDVVREVALSADERRAYETMVEDLRVELGGGEAVEAQAAAKMMKLRQITGGHVYHDGRVAKVGRSKLDELAELLEEIGPRQVVVWCEFTAEIDAVMELLVDAARIDGRSSVDDRTKAVEDFQAGRLRYLVCHPQAAGHGITLTAAAYDVFFSLSFSYETHEQARNRIYRTGQTKKVTHYYLVAADTVDHQLLAVLRRKQSMSEAVKEILGGGKAGKRKRPAPAADAMDGYDFSGNTTGPAAGGGTPLPAPVAGAATHRTRPDAVPGVIDPARGDGEHSGRRPGPFSTGASS